MPTPNPMTRLAEKAITPDSQRSLRRAIAMTAFVLAGESVFFLPFVIARVFRPTMLEVLQITNLELGTAFSFYGLVAMVSYFLGGPLADRFAPRRLMCLALIATAVGGLVVAMLPGATTLNWLYGYWGLTTILLFWSPLIRATRDWAGGQLPGRAFGLLDGGRGLAAAAVASIAVAVFSWTLPMDVEVTTAEQRATAFQQVVLVFMGFTMATGVLVWFAVPQRPKLADRKEETESIRWSVESRIRVARMPTVWLQAAIVVCAYSGYKGLDDISLYADEALGFDEVGASKVSAMTLWMRPIAAIAAGLLADRWSVSRMTILSFAILGVGSTIIASGQLAAGMTVAIFTTFASTSAALFALRGLYFAIMEEARIPIAHTGFAVGIVSFIGYTPDVYMGPLMGYLLDRSPGAVGHHQVFAVVAIFAWLEFVTAFAFAMLSVKRFGSR